MNRQEWEAYELQVVKQIDGHWCNDWDGLAVSAWTLEYDGCVDFKKTWRGRVINWLVMRRFNLSWWWTIGRHAKKFPQ